MLLEKLNGTVPCLLDTTTVPPEDLAPLKPSRSGADSGICEGQSAGGARNGGGGSGGGGGGELPSSTSSAGGSGGGGGGGVHPYNRTFSPHFHAFVELCLQREPEKR